ncbi:MAG: hypothetical protein WAO35_16930 [Terriglobia bacterium]
MLTRTVDPEPNQQGLEIEGRSRAGLAKLPRRDIPVLASLFARSVRRPREVRSTPGLAILFLLVAPALSSAVELKPETLRAWDAYVGAAKARMEKRASGQAPFLWVDDERDLAQRVRAGEVLVGPANGDSPHPAPHGLIHDWIGAVFIPKAHLDDVMAVLDDYGHYPDFYKPMVAKSRLLEKTPDHEKVTLLMVQKAYGVTGAVETDDQIRIARLDAHRAYSWSISVRVQEIAGYGQSSERLLPEDRGPGYVWRTFGETRLEERDGGVYVEMEMTDLSRDIPLWYRWLVQPLAEHLPRTVLRGTLQDTRDAVSKKIRAASLTTRPMAH